MDCCCCISKIWLAPSESRIKASPYLDCNLADLFVTWLTWSQSSDFKSISSQNDILLMWMLTLYAWHRWYALVLRWYTLVLRTSLLYIIPQCLGGTHGQKQQGPGGKPVRTHTLSDTYFQYWISVVENLMQLFFTLWFWTGTWNGWSQD